MKRTAIAILAAAAAGACSTAPRGEPLSPMPMDPAVAQADLRDARGGSVARASVSQVGDAVRVRVEATGLAPGIYGAHVHAVGRCDAPTFDSAGPHWNPSGRQHGRDNPGGQHMGDLPNLLVGTDRRGSFEFTIAGAELAGGVRAMQDSDGASIVLHARPDDYRTDPSGNSGARIACGVLG
jgi:Cu-Zn family superoxide dismutase